MKHILMITALLMTFNATAGTLKALPGVGMSYSRNSQERVLTKEELDYIAKERQSVTNSFKASAARHEDRQNNPEYQKVSCEVQVRIAEELTNKAAIEANNFHLVGKFNYKQALDACKAAQ